MALLPLGPRKSLRFLVIGQLQKRCSDFFGGPTGKYVIHVYTGTKIHVLYKVWWLRQASQVGQTFLPLCEHVV